ncbi:MAG: ATP-grasp domain-containing protein [Bacteroidales bacterium]|nr:ATP-grasp domain-containing protein [Clostridium sp.]MCM1502929.1 ATP-grasp domain-containing protein [Bacteroidales bacterium]
MGMIGPAVKDSLSAHGLDVSLVEFEQNVFRDEPGYRRSLTHAIAACRPSVVLPIGHTLAMARYSELLRTETALGKALNAKKVDDNLERLLRKVMFVVADERHIRLLDSKVQCCSIARSIGIRQPAVFREDELRDSCDGGFLIGGEQSERIKVIFKRDISFGGHGVHRPMDMTALGNLVRHQSPGEPYLIEEYVDGEDCSLDVVRLPGCFYAGGYRSVCQRGNCPSESRVIIPPSDPILQKMIEAAYALLGHIGYFGVCGFDFRVDWNGEVYLLECNPRFTGGIATQIASGFDIPWLLVKDILDT